MSRLLAVAHQTSESPEFVEAVVNAAVGGPEVRDVVLLIPATPVRHFATLVEGEAQVVAKERADRAAERLRGEGVSVVDVLIGDAHPYEAVIDALAGDEFEAVIISTFPPGISRWLGMNVIQRLERTIDTPVIHVVAD